MTSSTNTNENTNARTKLNPAKRRFARKFVKTGNATLAVKETFGIEDPNYAGVKGSRLLREAKVKEAVADYLNSEDLAEKHKELLALKRIDYFVFPKMMKDEDIVAHVASVGITVITVREGDKGKYAFYAIADGNAIKGGLDMAYKLKGSYAPEKSVSVNVDMKPSEELQKIADYMLEAQKNAHRTTTGSGGVETVPLDSKASD